MRSEKPPVIACWLLNHLVGGRATEYLMGDLIEEFGRGRSRAWFWGQALSAIVLALSDQLRRSMSSVAFALCWSALAPMWFLYIDRVQVALSIFNKAVVLPFPYSGLCMFLAGTGFDLVFTWLGVLTFALLHIRPEQSLRLTSRFATSTLVFLTSLVAFGYLLDMRLSTQGVTLSHLFTERQFLLYRLPFFFSLLASLWTHHPQVAETARS